MFILDTVCHAGLVMFTHQSKCGYAVIFWFFIIALLKYFNDGFEVNDNVLRRNLLHLRFKCRHRPRGTHRPRAI